MKRRSIAYLGLFLLIGACTEPLPEDSGSGALAATDTAADRRASVDSNTDPKTDLPILCTSDADVCPDGTVCDPLACAPSCPGCEDCNPACVPAPILCDPKNASSCPDGTRCDPNACTPSCPACDDCNPACVPDTDPPVLCCDIAEMPGFNGNPICFEGATCCGDGTWQCNQGNGQPSCEVTSEMCPVTECGGFGPIPCPDGQSCVDFPFDGCDPDNGGADCGGVCIDDHLCN